LGEELATTRIKSDVRYDARVKVYGILMVMAFFHFSGLKCRPMQLRESRYFSIATAFIYVVEKKVKI